MIRKPCSISVISANYNNGPYLKDFFDAFIESSAQPKELIFVDDGSNDNSLEIAESYKSKLPCLKIIELKTNQGFANALNAGIDEASADFILRTDPDDWISRTFLEVQYSRATEKNLDILGCNLSIFRSSDGKVMGTSNIPLDHHTISKRIRSGGHGVLHTTVLIKRELLKDNRYIQANVPAEDYDIFARFLRAGARFGNSSEALVNYRVHDKSITSQLPYSTIKKTYGLRDSIFGTKTFFITPRLYHLHLKLYRKSLFLNPGLKKTTLLALSALLQPQKLISKIIQIKKG
ncbi:MAG: glycosyltransferase family 2 protein [Pseudomonadales bacterium]